VVAMSEASEGSHASREEHPTGDEKYAEVLMTLIEAYEKSAILSPMLRRWKSFARSWTPITSVRKTLPPSLVQKASSPRFSTRNAD
jgi:hypothetical protein